MHGKTGPACPPECWPAGAGKNLQALLWRGWSVNAAGHCRQLNSGGRLPPAAAPDCLGAWQRQHGLWHLL